MPVTHCIQDDLLVFKASDEVSAEDFYAACDKIHSDPAFRPPIDALVDLREAQVDIPGKQIENMVYHLKAGGHYHKMVIVAARGSFTYAMGRMFCLHAECIGFSSEIFLNRMEALAWLEGPKGDARLPLDDGG
jgi:hypothetical protein